MHTGGLFGFGEPADSRATRSPELSQLSNVNHPQTGPGALFLFSQACSPSLVTEVLGTRVHVRACVRAEPLLQGRQVIG